MSAEFDFRQAAKQYGIVSVGATRTSSTDLPEMPDDIDGSADSESDCEDGCISADEDEDLPLAQRRLGLPEKKRAVIGEIQHSELEIVQNIGDGVTASVFLAKWNGEFVAVKQIKSDKRTEVKLQTAFKRELDVLSTCQHPNLCCFRGASLNTAPLQLVTEYCAGGTLFEYLHSEGSPDMSWGQALKICLDVARGMNYLHTSTPSVIHRDLKSLNLLLLQRVRSVRDVPHVKVADFGTARIKTDLGAEWDNMTKNSGTFHWMAPEVHLGNYCEKADVYSYAMVLFEVLCREVPFEDMKSHQVTLFTVQGGRPDLEAVPPDCPRAFVNLMTSCWDHDPTRRPSFTKVLEILGLFPSNP